MKKHLVFCVMILGLILLTITFVPATAGKVCNTGENGCCVSGEECMIEAIMPVCSSEPGAKSKVFKGCDDNCKAIWECEEENLCTDTDGGKDYSTKGESFSNNPNIDGRIDCCKLEYSTNMGDVINHIGPGGGPCIDSGTYLYEAICEDDVPGMVVYACPNGCENGMCILNEEAPSGETGSESAKAECPEGKQLECWGGVCTCILIPENENEEGGEGGQVTVPEKAIQQRNRLMVGECPIGCECTGSVTECILADGTRKITINAGASGNIIIQIKGVDFKTEVVLYHHNGKIYGDFEDEPKEIKIFPDEVEEKVNIKVKATLEDYDVELGDDAIYTIEAKKRSRLFFLFPVREKISAKLSSQTGEIIKIRNPWWGFLARDSGYHGEMPNNLFSSTRMMCYSS